MPPPSGGPRLRPTHLGRAPGSCREGSSRWAGSIGVSGGQPEADPAASDLPRRAGVGVPAVAADLDGVRDAGSRGAISLRQSRPEATALAQAGNGGAENQLDVQLMAAARTGPPYLGRHHALGVERLHLELTTPIEVEGLSGPSFVGGVLIRRFGIWCTGGIVHFAPSSPAAYPP